MCGGKWRLAVLGLLSGLVGWCVTSLPLAANPNERYVKPGVNVQDKDAARNAKLWVLDFKFKDPRLLRVNIPGRGTRDCWYLWYQVINHTGEPRTFVPRFELVTHDTNMTYLDQILPAAEEKIRQLEDPKPNTPGGYYKMRNSVTISSEPIPLSLPKAAPRAVTGVAIWVDPNEINPDDDAATKKRKAALPRLADSNRYSIFVAGLSNGWAQTDPIPPDKTPVIRRKSLQLSFRRIGDKFHMKNSEIRFQPPATWVYRGSSLKLPEKTK